MDFANIGWHLPDHPLIMQQLGLNSVVLPYLIEEPGLLEIAALGSSFGTRVHLGRQKDLGLFVPQIFIYYLV